MRLSLAGNPLLSTSVRVAGFLGEGGRLGSYSLSYEYGFRSHSCPKEVASAYGVKKHLPGE